MSLHKAYNLVSALRGYLRAAAEEDWTVHLKQTGLNAADTRLMWEKLGSMMDKTATKAEQFLSADESSWKFLQDVWELDPNQILSIPLNLAKYTSVPGLSATATMMIVQWQEYERTVRALQGEHEADIIAFWRAMMERTPTLAILAINYVCSCQLG